MARTAFPRGAKLSAVDAAARANVRPATFRAYRAASVLPPADGHVEPCGCPWWYAGTIDAWRATRRPSGGRPRKA